jgi:hypothetical protein
MLCVNVDKLAKGVAREPWDGTRNAKSCKLMMVAGTAGASGVKLMLSHVSTKILLWEEVC